MRISIEFKQGVYTVRYGGMKAQGQSVANCIEQLVSMFRDQIYKFLQVEDKKRS